MTDDKTLIDLGSKKEPEDETPVVSVSTESTAGGSGEATSKQGKSVLNVNAKRDKSPAANSGGKSSGHGTGSLALKVATQDSRLSMLRTIHERVLQGRASDFTLSELSDIRGQSNEIWAKFSAVHELITESCTQEFLNSAYVRENTYTRACSFHCDLNARLARYRDELAPPQQSSSGGQTSGSAAAMEGRAHLPKIALPTFSGDYSQWISFRDLFTSLVINHRGLNDVDRMHYLRTSTTGEAAKLIASLAIEADSFPSAWGTITERYQNDRILVTSHLESLFKTTVITPRSPQDLHALLHTITEACNALRVLGAPTQHWDWVLVYAIARRLDPATREAWELKAGQSRDPPTFALLRAFLTSRARALEGAGVGVITGSTSSGANSLGTTSKNTQRDSSRVHVTTTGDHSQCAYCRANHYIVTCPKFRQLSAEARRAEVQKLRLCFNCLGRHNVAACNNNTRCKECDRKHHTMIHVGWSKFGDGSRPASTPSAAGGAAGNNGTTTGAGSSGTSSSGTPP